MFSSFSQVSLEYGDFISYRWVDHHPTKQGVLDMALNTKPRSVEYIFIAIISVFIVSKS